MSHQVIISVDGDNEIGLGHVYRSINLAKTLKKSRISVCLLTNSIIVKKLAPKNIKIVLLAKRSDLKTTLAKIDPKIIVIDKLKEHSKTINIFKQFGTVLAIDYIGKNKSSIDIGINMLYPISGLRNKNSHSGLEYSILNQKFQNIKSVTIGKDVKKLLVIQGGSDTPCFTPSIIETLNEIESQISITVVLGPAFKCWAKLNKSKKNSKKQVKIFHRVKNMSSLMKKHDLAITGGGMTLLEFSRLGVPAIVICGADFENETATMLERKGFGVNLGFNSDFPKRKLISAMRKLITNHKSRQKMNQIGPKLVDGRGAYRVAQIIKSELV